MGPLLAIDTSGATVSVALYEGRVLAETSWRAGRRHSRDLLPVLEATLQLAEVDKRSLEAIAVASGPGSYSGLRVGVTTANGLGLALGVGVVHVPTLEALAYAQGQTGQPVRAAIEVGRGRYASARFRNGSQEEGGWPKQATEIASTTLEALCELAVAEGSLLVVDLDPGPWEEAQRHASGGLRLCSPAASLRRAGFLAELAHLKLLAGDRAALWAGDLIYLGERTL